MDESWRERLRAGTASVIPGSIPERVLLLLLLLLALALRAWRLTEIPFTHDEISALLRLRFSTFGALIAEGVAIDAHPAGVHVFEWLWTGLFGTSEAAVKLPFILMSVAALFFLYRFAAVWTSPAAALLSIAFIGTIQYSVLYGQIARPYAAGAFTCALLVDQLSRAIGGRNRAWLGTALAAALCAYTHHFALLFAGIAGVAALFMVTPAQRKPLLFAGAGGLLLYAPHIPIFLRQLSYAGVGQWLEAPGPYWLRDHVAWVFQFSWPLVIAVLAIGLVGWVRWTRSRSGYGPFLWSCLALGLLPMAIGAVYSLWRAPVLQHSVLLFSFPFLVFPVFAAWRNMAWPTTLALTAAITATALYGLIGTRQHYTLFYASKYEAIVQEAASYHAAHPDGLLIVDCPPEVIPFYLEHLKSSDLPFVQVRGRSVAFIDSLLRSSAASSAFVGWTNAAMPELWSLVTDHLPFRTRRVDLVEGGWGIMERRRSDTDASGTKWSSMFAPQAVEGRFWEVATDLALAADTGTRYGGIAMQRWDLAGHEYGILFSAPLDSIQASENDRIDVTMAFSGEVPKDLALVAEVQVGDSTVFYRTGEGVPGSSQVHVSVELATLEQRDRVLVLRTYLWNRSSAPALVEHALVRVTAGNAVLYGLFEPVPRFAPFVPGLK